MKRLTVFFVYATLFILIVLGISALTSCKQDIAELSKYSNSELKDLPMHEQQLFNASMCDSNIIRDAIIVDNKVIYYEPTTNQFVTIETYNIGLSVFLSLFIGIIVGFIIMYLIDYATK